MKHRLKAKYVVIATNILCVGVQDKLSIMHSLSLDSVGAMLDICCATGLCYCEGVLNTMSCLGT